MNIRSTFNKLPVKHYISLDKLCLIAVKDCGYIKQCQRSPSMFSAIELNILAI